MFNFFSRGDLNVTLEKLQFSPGDSVVGKVALKLKKPTLANKMSVSVIGQNVYSTMPRSSISIGNGISIGLGSFTSSTMDNVKNIPETQTEQIFSFELPLDGSKEYLEGEYSFSVKLPANIIQPSTSDMNGVVGAVANFANTLGNLTGGTTVKTEWFVEAQLDIPGAIDMRKKVMINVA